jgi:hypothetical protein
MRVSKTLILIDIQDAGRSRFFAVEVNRVSEGVDQGMDRTLPRYPTPAPEPWRA